MFNAAGWVVIKMTEKGAAHVEGYENWWTEYASKHVLNHGFTDDSGLTGGYLKVAQYLSVLNFYCVSVRRFKDGLILVFALKQSERMLNVKEGYTVASMLGRFSGVKLSGVVFENESTVQWFYSENHSPSTKRVVFNSVYLSNIERGFVKPEDVEGLRDIINVLNIKEQVMLTLMEPSLSGVFPKLESIIVKAESS